MSTPEPLPFNVVFATSELPHHLATQLEQHGPNRGSWTSDLRCSWPIEIGLRLFERNAEPLSLLLTSHATFVPRRVEIFLGRTVVNEHRVGNQFTNTVKDADIRRVWHQEYKSALFTRLGALEFLEPDHVIGDLTSTRRKRRRQTVEVNIPPGTSSNFVRLLLHEPLRCFPRADNAHDQVGLRSVKVIGFRNHRRKPQWRTQRSSGHRVQPSQPLTSNLGLGLKTAGDSPVPFTPSTINMAAIHSGTQMLRTALVSEANNSSQNAQPKGVVFSHSQSPFSHGFVTSKVDEPNVENEEAVYAGNEHVERELPMRSQFVDAGQTTNDALDAARAEGAPETPNSNLSRISSTASFSSRSNTCLPGSLTQNVSKAVLLPLSLGEFEQFEYDGSNEYIPPIDDAQNIGNNPNELSMEEEDS